MTASEFQFGLDVVYHASSAMVVGKLVGSLQLLDGSRHFAIQSPGGVFIGNVDKVKPLCLDPEAIPTLRSKLPPAS